MQNVELICRPDYVDNGIILVNDARTLMFEKIQLIIPDTSILLFVRQGYMTVEIDDTTKRVAAGQMLLRIAGKGARRPRFSDDFKGHAILFNLRFGQQIISITGNIWKYLNKLDNRPVIDLPMTTAALLNEYYGLLKLEVKRHNNLYYNEIVPSLLRNMLYSLVSDLRQSPLFEVVKITDYDGSPQSLALFHRFIDIMVSEICTHRDISYYARRLCVSSKHLSAVCKRVSQRTARQWICQFMINGITNHLRSGDKSIKEVSVIYGFPNMSVFSKFVKQNLGMTPSQVSKSLSKDSGTRKVDYSGLRAE